MGKARKSGDELHYLGMQPAALVILQDPTTSHILLVKRKDVPIWVIPGGGIDEGEEPECAALRELFEETTLSASKLVLRCHLFPVNRWAAETFIFFSNFFEGSPVSTAETAAVAFFPLDQLPDSLFIIHRQWLFKALSTESLIQGKIEEVTWKSIIGYAIRSPKIVFGFLWTYLTKL